MRELRTIVAMTAAGVIAISLAMAAAHGQPPADVDPVGGTDGTFQLEVTPVLSPGSSTVQWTASVPEDGSYLVWVDAYDYYGHPLVPGHQAFIIGAIIPDPGDDQGDGGTANGAVTVGFTYSYYELSDVALFATLQKFDYATGSWNVVASSSWVTTGP